MASLLCTRWAWRACSGESLACAGNWKWRGWLRRGWAGNDPEFQSLIIWRTPFPFRPAQPFSFVAAESNVYPKRPGPTFTQLRWEGHRRVIAAGGSHWLKSRQMAEWSPPRLPFGNRRLAMDRANLSGGSQDWAGRRAW